MRSTKYDKKGLLYEDMINPLENFVYKIIYEAVDVCRDASALEVLATYRKDVPEMARRVVEFMNVTDETFRHPHGYVCISRSTAHPVVHFYLKKSRVDWQDNGSVVICYNEGAKQRLENWKVNFPSYIDMLKEHMLFEREWEEHSRRIRNMEGTIPTHMEIII